MKIESFFFILLLLIWFTFWIEGTPCITDCVMAELEKLGQKYRVALRYPLNVLLTLQHFPRKLYDVLV